MTLPNKSPIFTADYFEQFADFRRVPIPVLNYYLWLLFRTDITDSFLDVGAGTGQFSTIVSRDFELSRIGLIEPSGSAATQLLKNFPNQDLFECGFREFCTHDRQKWDRILFSEVTHLLNMSALELSRAILDLHATNGRVLIRTSSHTQLKERFWYTFFPAALELDVARHIDLDELSQELQGVGYVTHQVVVDESRWIKSDAFQDLISNRSFSTLREIPEGSFIGGLKAVEAYLANREQVWYDYRMTALYATRI